MAMKKVKYITASSLIALADKVSSHLEQNWQVHGDVQHFDNQFVQAMFTTTTGTGAQAAKAAKAAPK